MDESYYDVAQICLNGHVINALSQRWPKHNTKYCVDCGAKTTTKCQECDEEIRGELVIPGVAVIGPKDSAPKYCIECGKPYPWTRRRIEAFRESVDSSSLDQDSKKTLSDGVVHITRHTPKTERICALFVKIISKESLLGSELLAISVTQAREILEALWAGMMIT